MAFQVSKAAFTDREARMQEAEGLSGRGFKNLKLKRREVAMNEQTERREFLTRAGLSAAGLMLAGAGSTRGYWANETIGIGCIGCGGRFRHLQRALRKIEGVQIVGLCDIYDENLDMARQLSDSRVASTKSFRKLLDRKDVDAVLIATPDHWHVPITIAACEAGKDIYVEKPLTHDLKEGKAVIDAQNRHQRIVQVGMQQRSMPQFLEAYDIVRSGELGAIHKVHLTWNRNQPRGTSSVEVDRSQIDWKGFLGSAPDQPFDPFRFRQWRWFWDFGGGILTDLMTHFIDVVNWYLDLSHPELATTIGDNFQTKGLWETPDTIQTLLQYPEKELQVYFEGTFVNARNAACLELMGSNATLYLDRGRYEVHPEPGRGEYREKILGVGGRGSDFYLSPDGELLHLTNWVECMRNRKRPNAPAEAGVLAVVPAHLGNRAFRSGAVARWEKNAS